MKRLVCTAQGELAWEPCQLPPLGPEDVRVECEYGAEKHGTMAAFIKGYAQARGQWDWSWQMYRPGGPGGQGSLPLGNMQVGRVVERGKRCSRLEIGARVCLWHCFQRLATAPETACRQLSESVPWKDATLLDPAEFAFGAIRDGGLRIGDEVAVFGMGAIGLVAVQLAKLAGAARVFAVELFPKRRDAALKCGAEEAIDPSLCDAGAKIKELTNGRGVDVAIDFSGSAKALQQALKGAAYGGTVVCGAFPPPYSAGLDFGAEAHMNRPRIVFSRACSDPNPEHPRWSHSRISAACFALIESGAIKGEHLVDEPVAFEALPEAYKAALAKPQDGIKLSVEY